MRSPTKSAKKEKAILPSTSEVWAYPDLPWCWGQTGAQWGKLSKWCRGGCVAATCPPWRPGEPLQGCRGRTSTRGQSTGSRQLLLRPHRRRLVLFAAGSSHLLNSILLSFYNQGRRYQQKVIIRPPYRYDGFYQPRSGMAMQNCCL